MEQASSIVDELESVLKFGSSDRRIEVLQRVTDLFANNARMLAEKHVALFDDVMSRLVSEIENRALVELSNRLSQFPNAPAGIIRRLAWHDAAEVAGPVLAKSGRLTDDDLVELAGTKGQAHLAQIATRMVVHEPVTDVLVERGDSEVANLVAGNPGARFSETGLWQLVTRADGDDRLTETLGGRPGIPPYLFRQLLRQAAAKVKRKLLASAGSNAQALNRILADISLQVTEIVISSNYAGAQRKVRSLSQDTEGIKTELLTFAQKKQLPELAAALSMLAAIPIDLVDQLIRDDNVFGLMVLCKTAALDWTFMHAVIRARPFPDLHTSEMDEASATYLKLSKPAAQRALRFWQANQINRMISQRAEPVSRSSTVARAAR